MAINTFTAEQIKELSKNPYVLKVSEKSITYSEEFKNEFIMRLESGSTPAIIMLELGFDIKVLKQTRISEVARRCKKYALRTEGVKDTRGINSGRPRTKDLTPEEELVKFKHKNLILQQENEFLKKMIYLAKKVQWEKSHQQKNSK